MTGRYIELGHSVPRSGNGAERRLAACLPRWLLEVRRSKAPCSCTVWAAAAEESSGSWLALRLTRASALTRAGGTRTTATGRRHSGNCARDLRLLMSSKTARAGAGSGEVPGRTLFLRLPRLAPAVPGAGAGRGAGEEVGIAVPPAGRRRSAEATSRWLNLASIWRPRAVSRAMTDDVTVNRPDVASDPTRSYRQRDLIVDHHLFRDLDHTEGRRADTAILQAWPTRAAPYRIIGCRAWRVRQETAHAG
jgi:hypothetical protein